MELLVLENGQLIRYDVTYNKSEMHNFMRDIINQYGFFRGAQIKAKNGNEILKYCNEYRDLQILKTYEDNTRVHKGRKRVVRKGVVKSYLYSVTLIDYPEIYYTISNFIRQNNLDFRVFEKYLNAEEAVISNDLNYYIEEGYMSYDAEGLKKLKQSLTSEKEIKKYIDDLINKRLLQRECLKILYNLLILNPIEHRSISKNEVVTLYNSLFSISNIMPELSLYRDELGIRDTISISQIKPKDIERAEKNSAIIETIKNDTYVKIKK